PPPPVTPRTEIPPIPLAPVKPPISLPQPPLFLPREERRKREMIPKEGHPQPTVTRAERMRSEERRVGKECALLCRYRGAQDGEENKTSILDASKLAAAAQQDEQCSRQL